jgi:hypothetical protein
MVYDGSRALGFRGENPTSRNTQYQVRGFLFIWCRPNCRIFLTTAGSLLFFAGPSKCFFDYQADGASRALRSSIGPPIAGYQGNLTDGASVQARVVYLQDGLLAALRRLARRSAKQSDCGGRGAPVVEEQEERALRPRTNVRKRSGPRKRAWVPNPTGINQHRYAKR